MKTKVFLPVLLLICSVSLPFLFLALRVLSNDQNPIPTSGLSGKYDPSKKIAFYHGTSLVSPKALKIETPSRVLGSSSGKDKRIEVDLTHQKLYAYEGDKKVYEFLVSTGKWGLTPTGEFTIWTKLKYTLMSGGSKALGTYYYLPNVPYVMFFYNGDISKSKGFSIHGTYWHSNFGHPMSHGCVNMKTEEAATLFYWANPEIGEDEWSVYADDKHPGTKVIIYGETPDS